VAFHGIFLTASLLKHQAKYIQDGKIYALKIIQPEEDDDVSEFIELYILKRCHHPNIVGLLGTWKKGDEIFVRSPHFRQPFSSFRPPRSTPKKILLGLNRAKKRSQKKIRPVNWFPFLFIACLNIWENCFRLLHAV
jgi:serine/threonine protein kinase